jgi:hypothetical protein
VPSLWWTWTPPARGTLLLRGRPQLSGSFYYFPEWRAFTGTDVANLTELPVLDLQFDQAKDPSAAFRVEAGVPVNIAGVMWYGTNSVTSARLEFIPEPSTGTVGSPVMIGHWSGTVIWFPFSGLAGDRIGVERSQNLTDWSASDIKELEQAGVTWLGPYSAGWEELFLRVYPVADPE